MAGQISHAGGIHQLDAAQDGEEGKTGQSPGQQGANHSRRLAISIRFPAVQRCQAHLGTETDQ
jgi:hypothetical protein